MRSGPHSKRTQAVHNLAMTPWHAHRLREWIEADEFRSLTVLEAVEQLANLMPLYDHRLEQPTATGLDGTRWFAAKEQALADALWRVSGRPFDALETMGSARWALTVNDDGLWKTGL